MREVKPLTISEITKIDESVQQFKKELLHYTVQRFRNLKWLDKRSAKQLNITKEAFNRLEQGKIDEFTIEDGLRFAAMVETHMDLLMKSYFVGARKTITCINAWDIISMEKSHQKALYEARKLLKLDPKDTIATALIKMSSANPEVLEVLKEMAEYAARRKINTLELLHTLDKFHIHGWKIWLVYIYLCEETMENMVQWIYDESLPERLKNNEAYQYEVTQYTQELAIKEENDTLKSDIQKHDVGPNADITIS